MNKKVYFFDGKTKEFLYEKEINASFGTSIPNTTKKEPLELKEGFAVCFNKEQDAWGYAEDNRGKTVYSILDKTESKIDYIGSIKDDFTLLIPKKFDKWDEANKSWVEDSELVKNYEETQSKTQKEKELNALQVSLNNVSYDAHMEAMGNMGIVTAVASFEMWKAWASLSAENLAVYNAVFKQTIEWKGATNEKHVVQIESVAETAKKAMEAKAEILFKY